MISLLIASLFFTSPVPQDMPRAEAFLVKEGEVRRLEDRYDTFDLWLYRSTIGTWYADGRVFSLARLDTLPPSMRNAPTETRTAYVAGCRKADVKNKTHLRRMVEAFTMVADEQPLEFTVPHQLPRGYDDVLYCQGTNRAAIVCAFRPEKSPCWYLATWLLAPDDNFEERRDAFERDFLDHTEWKPYVESVAAVTVPKQPTERDLLRFDLHRGVAAFDEWHFTGSADFAIVDDLGARDFVVSLTNDLPRWRARFAEVLPSPLDGTNVLAVARIYSNREDFLEAAGEDMAWSAAYWSPARRELVACLPQAGTEELRRTIRHESFHQYLSYATSMMSVSPWLNEGYAQFFEDETSREWRLGNGNVSLQDIDNLGELLRAVLQMDYAQFYSGSERERLVKYRLAWSVAVFLEVGAPKVRFQPFKDLKHDYIEALLKSGDMRVATDSAFGSSDRVDHFISEWKRFWKNQ